MVAGGYTNDLSNTMSNPTEMLVLNGTNIQKAAIPSSAIVESGSNANGTYVKYSDGHMECYKTITVTGINITNKWGSLYENGSDILLGNFAQTFKERPTVCLTKSDGHGCFIQVHDKISTTSVGRCYVASATSRSNASLTFEIIAKGKTEIYNLNYIDRGYENIEDKFRKLGAKIERVIED